MERAAFLAPVAILLTLAGYKLVRGPGDPFYLLTVREDSFAEGLTAYAFLGGCVVSSMIVKKMYVARRYFLFTYYALISSSVCSSRSRRSVTANDCSASRLRSPSRVATCRRI